MEIKTLAEINLLDIDLVLLDLDNTLYDYHACHKVAMEALAKGFLDIYNIDAAQTTKLYKEARQLVHDRHHGTAVSHSRLFYVQHMVEKTAGKTDGQTILRLYNIYWDTFIEQMELFPDALPFLKYCRALNKMVVMVTDMTTEVQFQKIKKLNIEDYLTFIVTSEEAGIEKPHPFIFEYGINKALRLKRPISQVAVVGDDIKKDLHFSEIYAMHTFHIKHHA